MNCVLLLSRDRHLLVTGPPSAFGLGLWAIVTGFIHTRSPGARAVIGYAAAAAATWVTAFARRS